jgi:hypothetical protein
VKFEIIKRLLSATRFQRLLKSLYWRLGNVH